MNYLNSRIVFNIVIMKMVVIDVTLDIILMEMEAVVSIPFLEAS